MVCGGHRHLGGAEARTIPERQIPRTRQKRTGKGKKHPQLTASAGATAEVATPAPQAPEAKPDKKAGGIIQSAREKAGQVLRAVTGNTGTQQPPRKAEVISLPPPSLTEPQKSLVTRYLNKEIQDEVEANNGRMLPETAVAALKRQARDRFNDCKNFSEEDERYLDSHIVTTILKEVEAQKPLNPLSEPQKKKLLPAITKRINQALCRHISKVSKLRELGIEGALIDCDIAEVTEADMQWLQGQATRIHKELTAERGPVKKPLTKAKRARIQAENRENLETKLRVLKRPLTDKELVNHVDAMLRRVKLERKDVDDKDIVWLEELAKTTHSEFAKAFLPQEPEAVATEIREEVTATVEIPPKPTPPPKPMPQPRRESPQPKPTPQPRRESPQPKPTPRPPREQPRQHRAPAPQQPVVKTASPEASRQAYMNRIKEDLLRGQEAREARKTGVAQPQLESRESIHPALAALKEVQTEE
ncbi:hypothetical protein HOD15_02475, partial [Candidatus Peregrinibacteria bacterium]|nr:hypothetical protein [Candidatus Peregrinibacteria bacterium]